MRENRVLIFGSVLLWLSFIWFSVLPDFPVLDEDSVGKQSQMDTLMIMDDSDADHGLEEVTKLGDEHFIRFENSKYMGLLSSSVYWFQLTLDSISEGEYLEVAKPHLSRITMYQVDSEGTLVEVSEKGRSLPIANHEINYPSFVFSLKTVDGPSVIYFEVETDTYLQLPLTRWTQASFGNHMALSYIFEGLFFGMLLIMFVYNAILGLSLRDRTYLWLVGIIFGYGIVQAVWSGLAYVFIWPGAHLLDLKANPVAIVLTSVCLMLFTKEFLMRDTDLRRMKWLQYSVIVFGGLGALVAVVINVGYGIYLAMVSGLLAMLYAFSAVYIRKLSTRPVKIYLIAWEVFFAGNVMSILSGFGLIEYTTFVMLAPRIGSVLFVALFSLALADRINNMEYHRGMADEKSNLLRELHEINKKITSTRDINRVVSHLISSYTAMTGAEDGFVILTDSSEREDLRIYRPNTSDWSMHLDGERSGAFWNLLHSETVTYVKAEEAAYLQLDQWVKEVMFIPVINYDTSIGLIVLTSSQPIRITESVENLTLDYANQVAINIGNIKLLDEVTRSSRTDGLTGMHNRRYLIELAGQYYSGERLELPLSVMMIDIDHFKQVNDTYGHQVGDQILSQIAERLNDIVSGYGEIGRYGGEEFIAFFPAMWQDQVIEVAEEMRLAIGEEAFEIESNGPLSLVVTISIGIAYRNDASETIHMLIDRADQALYRAKLNGRNRVVTY